MISTGRLTRDHFKRFFAIAGGEHRIAFESQCDFKQFKDIGDIFNDQDGTI